MIQKALPYFDSIHMAYYTAVGAVFSAGGASAELIDRLAAKATFEEMIMGPLGALVLSIIVLISVSKYLILKDKKVDKLTDQLLKEKENHIASLKNIIDKFNK
jgi:phosphate/sulfate permease